MNSISWFVKKVFNKDVSFFPDEVSILNSKKEAKKVVLRNNFSDCKVYFNMRDMFTYVVVIAEK